MIFKPQQWSEVQQEKLVVSAAPFPPSELGRNKRYVFALPPRWDYDFVDGWEEAQRILGGEGAAGILIETSTANGTVFPTKHN